MIPMHPILRHRGWSGYTGSSITCRGPCPPIGRHRYFHKLYALDRALPDLGAATKTVLETAMAGHILEQAELMGTYIKKGSSR